jgi:hypothetical protein
MNWDKNKENVMKYKLSRSEWERIGSEQGWTKQADGAVPIVMSLHARMKSLIDALDGMDQAEWRDPKLESAAEKLHGDIVRFESLVMSRKAM